MADDKIDEEKPEGDLDTSKTDIEISQDGEPQDEMNSTMMAIDVSDLDLNSDTNTEIKIQAPSDEEIIQEQLEQKKSKIARLFSKFFKSKEKASAQKRGVPNFLKSYVGIWISDTDVGIAKQVGFYITRLVILALSFYLHSLLIEQTAHIYDSEHPIKNIYGIGLIIDIVLVFLVLLFKFSPGWLVALPLSLIAFIFSYGAAFFHTADPQLSSISGVTLSDLFNSYYMTVVCFAALITLFSILRSLLAKLLMLAVFVISAFPFVLNYFLKTNLELTFLGFDFLTIIPWFYAQPVYIVFHFIFPLLVIISLVLMFNGYSSAAKGFAKGLFVLMFFVTFFGFSLLQKNRVPHVFNFLIPMRLDVGVVEFNLNNQTIKIETRNFTKNSGIDTLSRYKMSLKKAPKTGEFLLEVVDEFGLPVKNLSRSDFLIYSDEERIKKFKIIEEPDVNLKRGNYILKMDVAKKDPLIKIDTKQRKYSSSEEVGFTLTNLEKTHIVTVSEGDEKYISLINPNKNVIKLPLSYFDSGEHTFEIKVFDELEQAIYEKKLSINIENKPEINLLSPLSGDSIEGSLVVLLQVRGIKSSDIKSVSYSVDGVEQKRSDTLDYFQVIEANRFSQGKHELNVTVEYQDKVISKKIDFNKQLAPKLSIVKPQLGDYALRNLDVKYDVKLPEGRKIAGLKVYVNGHQFSDLKIDNGHFTLPVSRWSDTELYLSLQATLDNGVKVSDWTQINKGLSLLNLDFDLKTLNFLNYKAVTLVLDASISTLDNWQGNEKWKSIKKISVDPQINSKIKHLNPAFVVFGGEKSHYFHDCNDVQVLARPGEYNQAIVKRKLQSLKPTGVSALASALKQAYKFNSEKIFLVVDSTDSCVNVAKALKKKIKANPTTQITVFVLGGVDTKVKNQLMKLADMTLGRYYEPENFVKLKELLLSEMVLSYELYSHSGDLIKRAPFGKRRFQLAPGNYVLKIPIGQAVKEVPFTLDNSSKTALNVRGEKGKIHVTQEQLRF